MAASGPNVAVSARGRNLAEGPKGDKGDKGDPGTVGAPSVQRVAGNAAVTAINNVQSLVLADPGGGTPGSPTVSAPPAPVDGAQLTVVDTTGTANAGSQKIGVNASGQLIEDPQPANGTFVTGTVYIVQRAGSFTWIWDAVKTHWKGIY